MVDKREYYCQRARDERLKALKAKSADVAALHDALALLLDAMAAKLGFRSGTADTFSASLMTSL